MSRENTFTRAEEVENRMHEEDFESYDIIDYFAEIAHSLQSIHYRLCEILEEVRNE